MSDLIDRKWLMECVDEGWIQFDTKKDANTYIHLIRDIAPSSLPKTGKWIYDGDCYICNKCGTAYSWWADSQTSKYCPNCGAMMKEGE